MVFVCLDTTSFGTPKINTYAEPVAWVFLALYLLVANVLLLNLLIAIFGWVLQRSFIIMCFFNVENAVVTIITWICRKSRYNKIHFYNRINVLQLHKSKTFLKALSSVMSQKGGSQNGCFKRTKQVKFYKKRTFLTPWYAHVCVIIRG